MPKLRKHLNPTDIPPRNVAKIAKSRDSPDNFGPTDIDYFENRAEGGIYTQHYEKAEIRISERDTPRSLGPADQIPGNVIVDCGGPGRRNVGWGRRRIPQYRKAYCPDLPGNRKLRQFGVNYRVPLSGIR